MLLDIEHGLAFVSGAALVILILRSALRTFVLPRSVNDRLTRLVFRVVKKGFLFIAPPIRSYEFRDSVMALFAPVALLSLPIVWVTTVSMGYMAMFWALGAGDARDSYTISGSSELTLGFAVPHTVPQTILAFSEASIGLVLVALLIAYLPTIYSAFARRELAVTLLEVRAGSPPSAVEMIARFQRISGFGHVDSMWESWESWFADIEESHTSLGILAMFRSPRPNRSWVTAAGAVLDAASLMTALVDMPRSTQAQLTIRAGYIALRHIADFFDISDVPIVRWSDPISISREEFDQACAELETAGVPLVQDREKAWHDFVGWRVNYDLVLLELAALVTAPYAPWSSDRARMRTHLTTGKAGD
jgi:prepilin signal peptidase PulO-like enzyme (type II secretory pathway)